MRFSRSSRLSLTHDLSAHCCREEPGDPTPDAPSFCPYTLGAIGLPIRGMHLLNVFLCFQTYLFFLKETMYIEKVTFFLNAEEIIGQVVGGVSNDDGHLGSTTFSPVNLIITP